MSAPSTYLALPLQFDVAAMQRESDQFAPHDWIAHFNTGAYENGWSCLPLRSPGGDARHIVPRDDVVYAATPQLARCPYLQQVLASFACETGAVRLMALEAGALIREHRDAGSSLADGITRIHIPIHTSQQVLFRIDGASVHFGAGQAWYMDASRRHAVTNGGATARVHLVIDCLTNAWLEQLFADAGFVPRPPPKYGDPSINDANVGSIIAHLRASGLPAMAQQADRLAAIAHGVAA